ncbi:MAG TPA: FKBP-type peptidyl-prolyl cis-trans isomerase [Solirubrobacterales bacterium]
MKKLLVVGLLFLLALQLGACGGSESTGASTEARDTTAEVADAPPEIAHPGDWAALKRLAGPNADRLLIPRGPAPEQVVVRELKVGKGPPVKKGQNFTARYSSFAYENAYPVEPYWGTPSGYIYGLGRFRKGWEAGLKGVREGGIRELIVPSSMAYENGARVYIVEVTEVG